MELHILERDHWIQPDLVHRIEWKVLGIGLQVATIVPLVLGIGSELNFGSHKLDTGLLVASIGWWVFAFVLDIGCSVLHTERKEFWVVRIESLVSGYLWSVGR
ncbi:unnamed protein product [Danaus chrysippus]|uniref:(African queen) hypothetical protein n=1 Tax=Danaus chrysippus TaxID=151541 RepID=A0A8J2QGC5_9NEOP|nr:unnamed protein product [Danaus chrysippus]